MNVLSSALKFRDAYHARPDLIAEHTDWSPTIALVAHDTGEAIALTLQAGRVIACHTGIVSGDLVVSADARTLVDILELKLGPNGPYLFGELTVRGAEADFLRLDYLATRLCREG